MVKSKSTPNLLYGLTELGNIVKLSVREETCNREVIKTVEFITVLNTKTDRFTDVFSVEKYGDIVRQTLSSDPKDIFDRLSNAKSALEKKEISLMKNLFLLHEYPKIIKPLKRRINKSEE